MAIAGIETGQVLDERYRVTGELGRGGFGVVFKGEQVSTGQGVAIKVLHMQGEQGDSKAQAQEDRFRREMQLIAQLKHPNIVRLIDTGQLENGALYTVLELIDGVPLSEYLETRGAMSVRDARAVMSQVLDALICAHSFGVVHRDLKPANIMVTETGGRRNAMVLDFGIAGIIEDQRDVDYKTLTEEGGMCGTPSYMSPEQFTNKPVTVQSDLYAWGLVFLEALTGQTPVDADSIGAIIFRHVSPDPIPLPPELYSHPLGQILQRALAKKTEERYTDGQDALEALEDCSVSDLAGVALRLPTDSDGTVSHDTPPPLSSTNTLPGMSTDQNTLRGVGDSSSALPSTDAPRLSNGMLAAIVASLIAVVLIVIFVGLDSSDESAAATGESAGAATDPEEPEVGPGDNDNATNQAAANAADQADAEAAPAEPEGPPVELVELPAAKATIGLTPEEHGLYFSAYRDELGLQSADFELGYLPEQTFERPALRVMKDEVTWGDWKRHSDKLTEIGRVCGANPPLPQADHVPITQLGYLEAQAFCTAIDMRLPTVKEWEAIARGPDGRPFAFDGELDDERAAHLEQRHPTEHPAWDATPEGVRGLTSGVYEWVDCSDAPDLPSCSEEAGFRGGAWSSPRPFWHTFIMGPMPEDNAFGCLRREDIGFRCVQDIE